MSLVTPSEKLEQMVEEASKDDVKTVSPDYHSIAMQISLLLSLQVEGEK